MLKNTATKTNTKVYWILQKRSCCFLLRVKGEYGKQRILEIQGENSVCATKRHFRVCFQWTGFFI